MVIENFMMIFITAAYYKIFKYYSVITYYYILKCKIYVILYYYSVITYFKYYSENLCYIIILHIF